MNGIEKFMSATLVLVGFALVLTNPTGTTAAGKAVGSTYTSIVGAWTPFIKG
jgi:multisubunit Na+/H+ antiporter MnhG subunit